MMKTIKKIIRKNCLRVTSLFICFAMCFTLINFQIPVEAFGNDISENALRNEQNTQESQVDLKGDLSVAQLSEKVLDVNDVPEILNEQELAQKGNVNRLYEQEKNLETVLYQNKNGTKTLYSFEYPVKYVDVNGNVKDKSTRLTNSSARADFGFVNEDNDIKTYYPNKLSNDKRVSLINEDIFLELSPISVKEKQYILPNNEKLSPAEYTRSQVASRSLLSNDNSIANETSDIIISEDAVIQSVDEASKPATVQKKEFLNEASQNKDAVVYDSVFGDNTSIRYSSTFEGIKEDIILNENTGAHEFSFNLKTGGLSLVENDDSYALADTTTGELKARIGDIEIKDNNPNNDENEHTDSIYNHHYTTETIIDNEEYIITVVVDENFLNDKNTIYPVIVDPTMEVRRSNIHDATIYFGEPDRQAGLTEKFIYTGDDTASGYSTERSLIKIPRLVEFINGYNIQYDKINSVKMRLYNYSDTTVKSRIQICKFNHPWEEATVSANSVGWNNQGALLDYADISNYKHHYWWEIKEAVKDWMNGVPNNGMLLRSVDDYTQNLEHKFCASDTVDESLRPFIEVDYEEVLDTNSGLITRKGDFWCWLASAEMVARSLYSTVTKTQDEAFRYAFNKPVDYYITDKERHESLGGGEAEHISRALHFFSAGTVSGTWKGDFKDVNGEHSLYNSPKFNPSNPSNGRLSEQELQNELYWGQPIILYVKPANNTGFGHLVVLSAYDTATKKYTMLDPCNKFSEDGKNPEGKRKA